MLANGIARSRVPNLFAGELNLCSARRMQHRALQQLNADLRQLRYIGISEVGVNHLVHLTDSILTARPDIDLTRMGWLHSERMKQQRQNMVLRSERRLNRQASRLISILNIISASVFFSILMFLAGIGRLSETHRYLAGLGPSLAIGIPLATALLWTTPLLRWLGKPERLERLAIILRMAGVLVAAASCGTILWGVVHSLMLHATGQ